MEKQNYERPLVIANVIFLKWLGAVKCFDSTILEINKTNSYEFINFRFRP